MADINISEFTIGNNIYKYTDESFQAQLDNKVDQREGYSLISEGDLTKLAGIPANANHTDVDGELSDTSENPVQNKVIKNAVDQLKEYATTSTAGLVKVGDSLTIDEGFLDIKNKVTFSNERVPLPTDPIIATITDNNGISHDLTIPNVTNVSITPATISGSKVKIADYRIDGVDGELWAPAGGGGGSSSQSVIVPLYENGSSAGDITLNDDYDNYDLLYFTVIKQAGGETTKVITSIETSKISLGDFIQVMGGSAGADWLVYEVNSKTALELDSTPSSVFIESIVGIKIGSVTVDSAIDATSENPVQNKVIKTALDGKVNTNGTDRLMTDAEGIKLAGIAAGAEVNVQADWNESDNTSDAYIANKPNIPSALDDLSDVSTTGVSSGQVLTYNGTNWTGATPSAGTVTDIQIDNVSVVSGGVANISTMTGAGASAAGTKGLVPAPASGDNEKYLRGDGTWAEVQGGGGSAEMLAPTPFIYSEDEEQVGIWTDGKPLYQKTIKSTTTPSANAWNQIALPTNISVKSYCGYCVRSTGAINKISAYREDSNPAEMLYDSITNSTYYYRVSSPFIANFSELNLTIQYTKTTDTPLQGGFKAYGFSPVIYSETEREIGVWTDGKPLYQRTIKGTTESSVITANVQHNISNIDTIAFYSGIVIRNDGKVIAIDHSRSSDIIWTMIDNTYIYLNIPSNEWISRPFSITIQYTKTTDVAGSGKYTTLGVPAVHYDDTEKIIGTYFGETLYEKTLTGTITSLGTEDSVRVANLIANNIDIKEYTMKFNINGTIMQNGVYGTANNYICGLYIDTAKNLRGPIKWGSETSANYIITIKYTKITS